MSTPGGLVDKQELIDAQLDTAHLGRVVNSKDASGAPINTSTNRTGGVNKTLDALEGEYQADIDNFVQVSDQVIVDKTAEFDASIANKEVEADAAIDSYRLLSKGPYTPGILIEDKFQYITYNGESYFATNPPYTTTATTPDVDGNLFLGGYTTFENVANKIGNKNELSNSNFLTPSPDAITHPNATPETYAAGTQIFSGVYAGDSGCTVTFINNRVNCTAGDYQFKLPNTGGLERVPVFTSSVSDYDGIPKTTGVSHTLVGDEYVVTVTPNAGDVFSVKFEQGSVATRHETFDSLEKSGYPYATGLYVPISAVRTDNADVLNKAIDSFNGARGFINLPATGDIPLHDSVDYKRCSIRSLGAPANSGGGGCRLTFDGAHGLYTSIEDNFAPKHEGFQVFSTSERLPNGQTIVSTKGTNYPKLDDVNTYGGEVGVLLDAGSVVENHYGAFLRVNTSRAYVGIKANGGPQGQSHTFYGGRHWNNATGYENEGTSDINFIGVQFESDIKARHVDDGLGVDSPAESLFVGCRDESAESSDIQTGTYKDIGSYWSGYRRPVEYTFNSGVISYHSNNMIHGVKNDCMPLAENLLRNASLKPRDNSTQSVIPAWTTPVGANFGFAQGPSGLLVGWNATFAFNSFEQSGIDLKAGRYTAGYTIQKDDDQAGFFSAFLQILDSSGNVIDESGIGGVDFTSVEYTAISGSHRGAFVVKRFELKNNYTNARIRIGANNANGLTIWLGQAWLASGLNVEKVQIDTPPIKTFYVQGSTPSVGSAIAGDIARNLSSSVAGNILEWQCDTGGINGSTAVWTPLLLRD